MPYCLYYQASVQRERCWLLTGIFRSFEHLIFDRTIDKANSVLEFFVPADQEPTFLEVMNYLEGQGVVSNLQRMENRLRTESV
ncbi:hypothetical protein HOL34_03790 [bacterium]|jgi:hypothetical protein|nr:hypothetical protein [bacterium]MBT3903645.1 hypothetical protein [bacterium]MBT4577691.1 hypothetical protein [bacterium]MBT5345532.1 hypothetical protein [bacterium]MBT6131323.1 hypothetical protein [bacterium]